jgi:hypothetical protein
LIGPVGGEHLPQQIAGDRLNMVAHRGARIALPHPRSRPCFLHQPNHALPAHALLPFDEVVMHARAPVVPAARRERGVYEPLQPSVVLCS